MCLKKQIRWNFAELTRALEWTVRSAGYMGNVQINFSVLNDEILAYDDSNLSKMAHSCAVKTLCVITCLCIIFAPIYFATRKNMSDR